MEGVRLCACPGTQSDAGPSGPSECRSDLRGARPASRPQPSKAIEGRVVYGATVTRATSSWTRRWGRRWRGPGTDGTGGRAEACASRGTMSEGRSRWSGPHGSACDHDGVRRCVQFARPACSSPVRATGLLGQETLDAGPTRTPGAALPFGESVQGLVLADADQVGVLRAESIVFDKGPSPDNGPTRSGSIRRGRGRRANRRPRRRVRWGADVIRSPRSCRRRGQSSPCPARSRRRSVGPWVDVPYRGPGSSMGWPDGAEAGGRDAAGPGDAAGQGTTRSPDTSSWYDRRRP
jgi:hypothetical protein